MVSQIRPRRDRLAKPSGARRVRRPEGFPKEVREQIKTRSRGVCELCCVERAVQIHHRRARGAGGTRDAGVNLASNGIHICLHCHNLAEGLSVDHPQRGRVQVPREKRVAWGWQVPKLSVDCPEEVPVLTAIGRVQLGVRGGKRVIDPNERW